MVSIGSWTKVAWCPAGISPLLLRSRHVPNSRNSQRDLGGDAAHDRPLRPIENDPPSRARPSARWTFVIPRQRQCDSTGSATASAVGRCRHLSAGLRRGRSEASTSSRRARRSLACVRSPRRATLGQKVDHSPNTSIRASANGCIALSRTAPMTRSNQPGDEAPRTWNRDAALGEGQGERRCVLRRRDGRERAVLEPGRQVCGHLPRELGRVLYASTPCAGESSSETGGLQPRALGALRAAIQRADPVMPDTTQKD